MKHGMRKELFNYLETYYPNLESRKVDLKDAIYLWGVNPKQILYYLSSKNSSLKLLEYGLQNCNMTTIIYYLQHSQWPDSFEFNFLLSPIIHHNNYSLIGIELASNYCFREIIRKSMEREFRSFYKTINYYYARHNSYFTTNKGRLFEMYAHTRLLSGGTFKVRPLSTHCPHTTG